jgi:hypothetical protein
MTWNASMHWHCSHVCRVYFRDFDRLDFESKTETHHCIPYLLLLLLLLGLVGRRCCRGLCLRCFSRYSRRGSFRPRRRRLRCGRCLLLRLPLRCLDEGTYVEIESKTRKQFIISQFRAQKPFMVKSGSTRGQHAVNLELTCIALPR